MNSREVGISNVMLPEPSSSGTYFNFKIGTVDYRHLNLPENMSYIMLAVICIASV